LRLTSITFCCTATTVPYECAFGLPSVHAVRWGPPQSNMAWSDFPRRHTRSLALINDDLDVPTVSTPSQGRNNGSHDVRERTLCHWFLCDIPRTTTIRVSCEFPRA